MKIQVVHTWNGISFYVTGPYGSAKIGAQPLNAIAMGQGKAELIKNLYEDGKEYDLEPFFKSWIAAKSIRIPRTDVTFREGQLKMLKEILQGAPQ